MAAGRSDDIVGTTTHHVHFYAGFHRHRGLYGNVHSCGTPATAADVPGDPREKNFAEDLSDGTADQVEPRYAA